MYLKQALVTTATILEIAAMGFSTLPETSSMAATTTKIVKTTTYKSAHKVHVQGGWMYTSSKLTHKNYHLTKYLYTKFYATKQVTVRQANGKITSLKYLTSKSGKVKGYVKTTNVRNRWGYGKYSVTAYRKNALLILNKERVKRGLKPLTETAKLDKVAQQNSDRLLKQGKNFQPNLAGTPHAGWVFYDYVAPKSNPIVHYQNGKQLGQGTMYALMGLTDRTVDYGAKPYLYSKNHTRIGFGGSQHGQAIYMFLVFSHD